MSVPRVLNVGLCLSIAFFVSACSHRDNDEKQQPAISNNAAITNAHLNRPKSSCEQIHQPILFSDQTAYKKLSNQLQQWTDHQSLQSGQRLSATVIQLPAKNGDRIRARLFVDAIAIWPTHLLMDTSSGQLAAADPELMKDLLAAEFHAFQANEKDIIERAREALPQTGKWIDSCRVYAVENDATSVQTSWLVNFQQGFGGTSVQIDDHSLQIIRTWPLAQD